MQIWYLHRKIRRLKNEYTLSTKLNKKYAKKKAIGIPMSFLGA